MGFVFEVVFPGDSSLVEDGFIVLILEWGLWLSLMPNGGFVSGQYIRQNHIDICKEICEWNEFVWVGAKSFILLRILIW